MTHFRNRLCSSISKQCFFDVVREMTAYAYRTPYGIPHSGNIYSLVTRAKTIAMRQLSIYVVSYLKISHMRHTNNIRLYKQSKTAHFKSHAFLRVLFSRSMEKQLSMARIFQLWCKHSSDIWHPCLLACCLQRSVQWC